MQLGCPGVALSSRDGGRRKKAGHWIKRDAAATVAVVRATGQPLIEGYEVAATDGHGKYAASAPIGRDA